MSYTKCNRLFSKKQKKNRGNNARYSGRSAIYYRMMNTKPWKNASKAPRLALVVLLAAALAACTRAPAQDLAAMRDVDALMASRVAAIEARDETAYAATVTPDDTTLFAEERNLIRAAKGVDVTGFTLNAADVRRDGEDVTATVRQSYRLAGESRACTFPARMRYADGLLLWAGPDFQSVSQGDVQVLYQPRGARLAGELCKAQARNAAALQEELSYSPPQGFVVKLYDDRQTFLQSIKLDLPAWVGGWHEYGEAIKLFRDSGVSLQQYERMLLHESVHGMLSDLSQDNAAYWLQEGMAGLLEDSRGSLRQPHGLTAQELAGPMNRYADQVVIDLERIDPSDAAAVSRYYATSKALAAFLMDTCGWDSMRKTLQSMQRHGHIAVTAAEKLEATQQRTARALAEELGLDADAMELGFGHWLAQQKAKAGGNP